MHRNLIIALIAAAFVSGWVSNGWRLKGEMNKREAAQAEAATAAIKKVREEDNRRTNALLETLNAAHADLARALSDRDSARAASDVLQQRARDLAASCGRAAPAGAGKATASAGDLLADMLVRVDEAAGSIAAHADRAVIAGRACERAYDSLGK